jgi:hypothetical protein
MNEERYQKELFQLETPKKRFPGLSGIFKKPGLEGHAFAVTLRMDKVVFLSIAIIMLMVIVYALGVERGRCSVPKPIPAPVPAQPMKPVLAVNPVSDTRLKAQVETQPQGTALPAKDLSRPYTIAVAALSKKDSALAEVTRLKKIGFDAFVIYTDPYYVVCVGVFADRTSQASQKELLKLKRLYKDAYFKQR